MAKVRKPEKRPPLNKKHKINCQDWAKKYLKTDFSKVLWTDEKRVTLDGPDGWARAWISKGQRAPLRLRHQQGGGGVLVWAGIINDELVGPFRVEDGVKVNCQFLEDNFFKQWCRKKLVSFKKNMIFMQDNAPSHASNYSTASLASKGVGAEVKLIQPESVSAQYGGQVRLSCTASGYEFSHELIAWLKQDQINQPVYMGYMQPMNGYAYFTEPFTGRFNMRTDNSKNTAYLDISDLQLEDAAVYFCARDPQ
ncbi:unnamed protein product [Ranitomeya imitator]|uniref:Ig-like domain-containing protein n=1 Tax=Ranitomeya imitator TaxID=111125 RepID=A0ABN9MBS8_9NEOB|nr:unnamed protein product [Ranitomeya imitator]